jgi:hypothetical protein
LKIPEININKKKKILRDENYNSNKREIMSNTRKSFQSYNSIYLNLICIIIMDIKTSKKDNKIKDS